MSDLIDQAVNALNEKMGGDSFDATAKFVIEDEGSIILDESGARASDDDADVTLTASAEVFQAIMSGERNPAAAFMGGDLSVDGDMGTAMRLSGVLS